MSASFFQELEKSSAHTENRIRFFHLALNNHDLIDDLFAFALNLENKNHYKAIWIVEMFAEFKIEFLVPYVDAMIEKSGSYKHQSALRGLSRTLFFVCQSKIIELTETQKEKLTTVCIDWLIGDYKVVVKWCSMQILLVLSLEYIWLKDELRLILEKDYPHQSPGYQGMAKKVLKTI